MDEELLSRNWTDTALLTLSPALDDHITRVIAKLIGDDVPWPYVLQELDSLKGRGPVELSRRDPAVQYRMLTERLGDLGYPFDRNNRHRLFSTYGQMLRLARNQLSHPDDVIEPVHAMTTIVTATQLASLIGATATVDKLNDLQNEVLSFLWSDQEDDTVQIPSNSKNREISKPNPPKSLTPTTSQAFTTHDVSSIKGTLSKRIVEWEPILINPIGEKDDLDSLRRVSSKRKVIQAIETVVSNYGPLSEDQLLTSVARAFGLRRRSSSFQRKIKHQVASGNAEVWRDQDGFYWPKGVEPEKWRLYRRDSSGKRTLKDISPYELVNLLEIIVREKPARYSKSDLLNQIRDEFDLQRLKGPTREQAMKAVHKAVDIGLLSIDEHEKFLPAPL
ncbi:hypothetical protein GCM10023190_17910 [Enteractinococcus fodinae]|uniref:DUF3320 domain-containing protein n=1 Tax=Enteractinococcus fodinae TaxID=684663 RepID=A0ABU2B5B4_9MICC|nr:hypothetical protein [Enteractinococcus fodinae]MDR7348451.1 hypothetical protein [Enteractinococcus fodinae]